MSQPDDGVPVPNSAPSFGNTTSPKSPRSWWMQRLCSQNPFYLISVCLVLHGTANWFHVDDGRPFSPWPLLWLTTGYTLMLALTGFVIIRFGQVWDDARSILLMILLMFVQLSLLFDETLVSDPAVGSTLLLICCAFSMVLTEVLLLGLKIRLPLLFRLPYHLLLALLYFYPLVLVPFGEKLSTETVVWRIFLFPSVAAVFLLSLIPAIRRGRSYVKQNGTPWIWPLYPWSLFVFLGVCLCFRAYALSQSFDPVLGETLKSAMSFSTAFGIYFLIPIVMATGMLILEIGKVERMPGIMHLGMSVPVLCFVMSFPSLTTVGPYKDFLETLTQSVGSPIYLTLLAMLVFYFIAFLRDVPFAEAWVAVTLLLLSRFDAEAVGLATQTSIVSWPILLLCALELGIGITRENSFRVFLATMLAITTVHYGESFEEAIADEWRPAITFGLSLVAALVVGAAYRDLFAHALRWIAAPNMLIASVMGSVYSQDRSLELPAWCGPVLVVGLVIVALGYAYLLSMPLYQLVGICCGMSGSFTLLTTYIVHLVQDSGWRGAASFASGIGFLMLAFLISSQKAGWLDSFVKHYRERIFQAPAV